MVKSVKFRLLMLFLIFLRFVAQAHAHEALGCVSRQVKEELDQDHLRKVICSSYSTFSKSMRNRDLKRLVDQRLKTVGSQEYTRYLNKQCVISGISTVSTVPIWMGTNFIRKEGYGRDLLAHASNFYMLLPGMKYLHDCLSAMSPGNRNKFLLFALGTGEAINFVAEVADTMKTNSQRDIDMTQFDWADFNSGTLAVVSYAIVASVLESSTRTNFKMVCGATE